MMEGWTNGRTKGRTKGRLGVHKNMSLRAACPNTCKQHIQSDLLFMHIHYSAKASWHIICIIYHENTMHNSLFTCNVWLLYHFYTEQIIHLMTQAWYFMHIALCLLGNFSRFFVICWPFSKPTFSKNSSRDTIKVWWGVIFFYSYCKTCVKQPLSKRLEEIGFQDQLSLNLGQKYCRMLQYFRPSLSYCLSLRSLFCLFFSGRFTQFLLYW